MGSATADCPQDEAHEPELQQQQQPRRQERPSELQGREPLAYQLRPIAQSVQTALRSVWLRLPRMLPAQRKPQGLLQQGR